MERSETEPILNNGETPLANQEQITKPDETAVVVIGTSQKPEDLTLISNEPNPNCAETGVEPIPKSIVSEGIQVETIAETGQVSDTSIPKSDETPTVEPVTSSCDIKSVPHESEVAATGPVPINEQTTLSVGETSKEVEAGSSQVEETVEEVPETEEERLENLKKQRGEIRHRITNTCDEISTTLQRVGSLTSLNAMVVEAEDLLRQSEELNDQICEFYELVDTAKEFQLQLEYQRVVQDAKEEVQNYSEELF